MRYFFAFIFLVALCTALYITEKNKKEKPKTELNERN